MNRERAMVRWNTVRQKVLNQLQPNKQERKKIKKFTEHLINDINGILRANDIVGLAEVHGSIAHDTWVRGEQDIDIFIVLDPAYDKSLFHNILELLKKYIKTDWQEAYAEHPYIKTKKNGYNIDFVPCFQILKGQEIKSSTDRTPLHTKYLEDKLTPELKDDVRLLKQFMRRIGVYGAEIKIGGFSGYLCELLILKYNGFWNLLEASPQLISTHKLGNSARAHKKHIIFPDPVDSKRNVASAVTETSFWTFVFASRKLMERPNSNFFFKPVKKVEKKHVLKMIRDRGSDFVFLVIEEEKAENPENLWGQLLKTQRAIEHHIAENEFKLIRSKTWSNERTRHIFTFELESIKIGQLVKQKGPSIRLWENAEKFLNTHLNAIDTISGPIIECDRLWIIKRRRYNNVIELLKNALKDGGRNIGVSKNISMRILQQHRILKNAAIIDYLEGDFLDFLNEFILGRPDWFD
jgi:tRNA nucleotidyltransferase (CCA-adding enzyme)